MTWIFSAVFSFMFAFLLWAVGATVLSDQLPLESQAAYIGGKAATVNREGCAEASNLCALLGGRECREFKKLTGESVEHYCCRTYGEGCYKQKPLPDGREGVGDR